VSYEPQLQRGYTFDRAESRMRASAREQLDMLGMFHRSTTTLGAVLEGLRVPLHAGRPNPMVDIQSAVLNLAVLALRTARGGGVLVRSGYEVEASAMLRRIGEAQARARAVLTDASGQHARDWLDGKGPSTPRKIAGKHGNLEFFDAYSDMTHATMTSLQRFVAVALEDGRTMVPISPLRNQQIANVMLLEFAIECRQFAMIVGDLFQREVRWLTQLDEELREAVERANEEVGNEGWPGAPSA
jgi:hypothetical protein